MLLELKRTILSGKSTIKFTNSKLYQKKVCFKLENRILVVPLVISNDQ